MEIADVFRVNVVDVTHATLTLEATGKPDKLPGAARAARGLRRSWSSRGPARIALARGDRGIRERVLKSAAG